MSREIWAIPVLLLVAGCSFRIDKTQPQDESILKNGTLMSYATVRERVFQPRCVSCHGSAGGLNLESYENARAAADKILQRAVIDRNMPRSNPLSNFEARIVEKWIRDGMPKDDGPPPDELKPNFESIKKNLFTAKCISCHSDGGEAERVPLDDYRAVMDSPRELVIPGNPEESTIIIAVTRTDERRMPPPKVSDHLTEEQIQVLNEWILNGAPEKE